MSEAVSSWPNLVGKDGNEAAEIIKRESGLTNVQIMKPGSICTMDYRTDRVRINVDEDGKVQYPPTVG